MTLILTVDSLGKRYGMLPSEALARASTFDLYIMDAALSFESYHNKKANNGGKDPIPDYSVVELQAIINNAKLNK